MARLLCIEASPAKSTSHSIDVAKVFLQAYQATHLQAELEAIDLWVADLPPFDAGTSRWRAVQQCRDGGNSIWLTVGGALG